jgi:hypothetical protein
MELSATSPIRGRSKRGHHERLPAFVGHANWAALLHYRHATEDGAHQVADAIGRLMARSAMAPDGAAIASLPIS